MKLRRMGSAKFGARMGNEKYLQEFDGGTSREYAI
jgi:hypothetical protein